jgi:hypothetical protein
MKRISVLVMLAGSMLAQSRQPRKMLDLPATGEKATVTPGYVPQGRENSVRQKTPRDGATVTRAIDDAASTTQQAPGVMQINLADPSRSSWFVSTDTIPAGSTIVPFIVPPGSSQQFLQLQSINVTSDIAPGTSLMLPQIGTLGDFWPTGVTTYDVLVKYPDGANTHAAADFCTLCARTYQDLLSVVPLIYDTSESLAKDGSVIVTINGNLTGDPVKATFEGLAVPANAIRRGTNNSVLINVSNVPGMHLEPYQDFLLTISQNGWSDTRIFTHVPFQPGSYIPSP